MDKDFLKDGLTNEELTQTINDIIMKNLKN